METEKSIVFNLRIPELLKSELEQLAASEKRSLNQQIVYMLERLMQEAKIGM